MKERKSDRDKSVGIGVLLRRLRAIYAWGRQQPQELGRLAQPVLIANGDRDIIAASAVSEDFVRRLSSAELVRYCDTGHPNKTPPS